MSTAFIGISVKVFVQKIDFFKSYKKITTVILKSEAFYSSLISVYRIGNHW